MPIERAYALAKHWRARAQELRAIAETMKGGNTRRALLEAADEWIRMAERAERRHATDHPEL